MNDMQPGMNARHPQGVAVESANGRPVKPGRPIEGPPNHASVQNVINLLSHDMRQLLEDIGELRAALSPILAEREAANRPMRPGLPIACRMANELAEIHSVVQSARELVEITLSQLEL